MPFEPASDILSDYTVLDLTRVRSGPTCVRQLADWGANVIKIENPDKAGSDMGGSREQTVWFRFQQIVCEGGGMANATIIERLR